MRKFKQALTAIMLCMLLCAVAFGAAACKKDKTGGGGDGPTKEELPSTDVALSLNVSSLDMVIGDEITVIPTYTQKDGVTLSFTSSQESVATVDGGGKITAHRVGSSTVTATYGEETATVAVNVGTKKDGVEISPKLVFSQFSSSEFTVNIKDDADFTPSVLFNGKTYTDVTLDFDISDKSVGAMDGNKFKPAAAGSTNITVKATWRDMTSATYPELEKVFKIKVKNDVELTLNGEAFDPVRGVELYTVESLANAVSQQTYATIASVDFSAKINGETATVSVEAVAGETLIEVDNNEKTVSVGGLRKGGETVIKVTCVADGVTEQREVAVKVIQPVGEYKQEEGTILFSAADDDLPVDDIFGSGEINTETRIVKAEKADGTALVVENGKIVGGLTVDSKIAPTAQNITVYSDTVGYTIEIKAYTKVIRDAEDLEYFTITEIELADNGGKQNQLLSATEFDGYYILADDIDASGYTHTVTADETTPVEWGVVNTKAGGVLREDMSLHGYMGEWDVATSGKYRLYSKLQMLSQTGLQREPIGGGLTGTFDGNGFNINNLTVREHGLFGVVRGGVIKNVGFNDVTLTAHSYALNLSLFAEIAKGMTVENVYIKANDLKGGDGTANSTASDARGNRTLIATSSMGNNTFKNCMFVGDIANTKSANSYSYGMLFMFDNIFWDPPTNVYDNLYVISNAALLSYNTSGNAYSINSKMILGENESDIKEAKATALTGYTFNGDNVLNYTGAYRYDTAEDMLNAKSDYSSFGSNYWNVITDSHYGRSFVTWKNGGITAPTYTRTTEIRVNGKVIEEGHSETLYARLNETDADNELTAKDFAVTAKIDGIDVDSGKIAIEVKTSDTNKLLYEDGKIKSRTETGDATLIITVSVDGEVPSKLEVTVHIVEAVKLYDGDDIKLSLMDNDKLPISSIFTSTPTSITAMLESGSATVSVSVDGAITGMPASGDTQYLILSGASASGTERVRVPLKAYTKIITKPEDLAIFKITEINLDSTQTQLESATQFDGYYILGNDIDIASDYKYDNARYYDNGNGKFIYGHLITSSSENMSGNYPWENIPADSEYVKSDLKLNYQVLKGSVYRQYPLLEKLWLAAEGAKMPGKGGLTGTFDGDGHKITGLTVFNGGLFGIVNGGTIKNVAFENVTLGSTTVDSCAALFAQIAVDMTMENVYIKANTIYGQQQKDLSSDARTHRALIATTSLGNNIFKNCVFEAEVGNTKSTYSYSYGSMFAFDKISGDDINTYDNVYVVSNAALVWFGRVTAGQLNHNNSDKSFMILGENEADGALEKAVELTGYSSFNASQIHTYTGVYRYDTQEAMTAAGNDYSSFSGDYWTVSGGSIAWGGATA